MIICLFLFLNFLKKIGKGNLLLNVMLGVWMLVFIILIFLNSQSLSYFTEEGIIIIFGHLFMICFGVLFSPKMSFRFNKFPLNFTVGIGFLFYILLILSLIGLYLFSISVILIDAITSNQMAQLRANVLLKELEVSPMTVLLTNFLYPLAAITPIYTLYNKKRFLLLLLVIILFFIYTLCSGGKGGVILMIATFTGAVIYLVKNNMIIFDRKLKLISGVVSIGILSVFAWLTYSRMKYTGDSVTESTASMFVSYFSTSVPAFCQLLKEQDYLLLNFDLTQHNLVKNIGAIFGIKYKWGMDSYIVYVPEPFNVFSSIADSIFSLGLIGSLFYYFIIGLLMGWVNKLKDQNGIFLFAVFFLFSFYSFFVDVFYFMAGSWFCVLFYSFINLKYGVKK